MKGAGGLVAGLFMLWLASVLQLGLAPGIQIAHAPPDFLLIVLSSAGLYCSRRNTTLIGFGAGLMQGVIAGANMTLYIASRAAVGFLLGCFNTLDVEVNAVLSVISAVAVTLLAQLLLLFLGGHHGPVTPYLAGTLISAVYNGVIALPVYALLNRFLSVPNSRMD